MSNEEIIAVEAVLRAYEAQYNLINGYLQNDGVGNIRNAWMNADHNALAAARGKIEGCKEVLRDLMHSKLS